MPHCRQAFRKFSSRVLKIQTGISQTTIQEADRTWENSRRQSVICRVIAEAQEWNRPWDFNVFGCNSRTVNRDQGYSVPIRLLGG